MNPIRSFQFSLKDLFLAVTLIALGLPGAINFFEFEWNNDYRLGLFAAIRLASATAIGAGIGAPFQKKLLCGVIGLILAMPVVFFMIVAILFNAG